MDKYRVYVHISPDSKRYYGATKLNINNRWRNGKGYKTQKYFWEAIQKYGWDNVKHEILFSGLSKKEADEITEFLKSINMNKSEFIRQAYEELKKKHK